MGLRTRLPAGYDQWKTASPYDNDEGDIDACARCGEELPLEGMRYTGYEDRGYCTSICEAFALRDQFKTIGAFTEEQGLDAEVWLVVVRVMRARTSR